MLTYTHTYIHRLRCRYNVDSNFWCYGKEKLKLEGCLHIYYTLYTLRIPIVLYPTGKRDFLYDILVKHLHL